MNPIDPNLIFKIKNKNEFENLALKIFEYQIENNKIYKKYASLVLKGKYPKSIQEIPFLPISFFKSEKIISKNLDTEIIFKSSGTKGKRSSHYVSSIDLYEKSFLKNFIANYGPLEKKCIIGILPSYLENGDSSLIYMVNKLIKKSKNHQSGFYEKKFDKLRKCILQNEEEKKQTIIIGVTYALLDFASKYPTELKNTIIIETGGMKGNRKELLKEEVHNILSSSFNIKHIHSEYGMTELLSQAYSKKNGVFETPKWMKILIRDIYDPFCMKKNKEIGAINVIDLANIHSCSFIATDDIGFLVNENKFKLSGRITNADVRGCNLLIE